MAEWRKNGVDQTLLDLGGKHTQALIRKAGGSGTAQHVLDAHLRKVEADVGTEAVGQIEKMVGEKRPAHEVVAALEKQRAATAAEKYPKQNATPIDYRPVMDALKDQPVRTVLNEVRNDALISTDPEERKVARDIDRIVTGARHAEQGIPASFDSDVRAGTLDKIEVILPARGDPGAGQAGRGEPRATAERAGGQDRGISRWPAGTAGRAADLQAL